MPDTYAIVPVIPTCDLCTLEHADEPRKAFADVKVPGFGWGNACKPHFDRFDCQLGVGKGQRYVLSNTTATVSVTMVVKGQPDAALRRIDAWNASADSPCLGFVGFPKVGFHGAEPLITFDLLLATDDGTTYGAVSSLHRYLMQWYGEYLTPKEDNPWPALLYVTIHKIVEPDGRVSHDNKTGELSTWLLNHGEVPA